jgi:hypothetical protein
MKETMRVLIRIDTTQANPQSEVEEILDAGCTALGYTYEEVIVQESVADSACVIKKA